MQTHFHKLLFLGFLFVSLSFNAQTLEETLSNFYHQFDTAANLNQQMAAAAGFDMAANQWPEEAMSNYYAAYSKAIVSYSETDTKRKDMLLDQAVIYFEKLKLLKPEDDETYVLAALIANARLSVDGASRWKEQGEIFNKNLEQAKSIDPSNPRIYYIQAISTYYTPKMFGGGAKKAKPLFEKAKELFPNQNKSSILIPFWGERQTEEYLKLCEKEGN